MPAQRKGWQPRDNNDHPTTGWERRRQRCQLSGGVGNPVMTTTPPPLGGSANDDARTPTTGSERHDDAGPLPAGWEIPTPGWETPRQQRRTHRRAGTPKTATTTRKAQ